MTKQNDLHASEEQLAAADPYIARLYRFGHFQNPACETALNVRAKDIAKLTHEDEAVKEAVWSYQEFFKEDLDEEAYLIHGRSAMADGLLGPATAEVIAKPRCGMPDYMARKEEARFPESCVNNLTVSFFFDVINSTMARAAIQGALKAWSDAIEMGFELLDEFTRESHIWATDSPLRGSTLAWSMLTQGRCTDRIEQRYNTRVQWTLAYLTRVNLHEDGHAFGMGHINSRAAVMNPSITKHTTPQPLDIEYMQRLGYTKRTTPKPPPPPDPDNPTGAGTITLDGKKYALYAIPMGR